MVGRVVELLTTEFTMQVLSTVPRGLGSIGYNETTKVIRTLSLGKLLSTPIAPLYPIHFFRLARKASAVSLHLPYPVIDAATLIALPKTTPLIIHYYADITNQATAAKLLSPLLHHTLKRADCIIVSNPAFIEYSPWLRTYKNRCHVVPFSIDLKAWQRRVNQDLVHQIKEAHGNFLLSVGRLVPYKGFEYLIRALELLPNTKLVIIGEGPERKNLMLLAEKLNLSHRIHITSADDNLLASFYHACQMLVLPSVDDSESFGIVQIEAMASGKPIINTNIPSGVPWVARNGIEGITVPPRDHIALAQAISKLLDNSNLMMQYGKAALERAKKVFSPEAEQARLRELYMQVVNKP